MNSVSLYWRTFSQDHVLSFVATVENFVLSHQKEYHLISITKLISLNCSFCKLLQENLYNA